MKTIVSTCAKFRQVFCRRHTERTSNSNHQRKAMSDQVAVRALRMCQGILLVKCHRMTFDAVLQRRDDPQICDDPKAAKFTGGGRTCPAKCSVRTRLLYEFHARTYHSMNSDGRLSPAVGEGEGCPRFLADHCAL